MDARSQFNNAGKRSEIGMIPSRFNCPAWLTGISIIPGRHAGCQAVDNMIVSSIPLSSNIVVRAVRVSATARIGGGPRGCYVLTAGGAP